jgi:Uma2 family endonuclease
LAEFGKWAILMNSSSALPVLSPSPPFPVRRFTVDEYQRMAQAGILTKEDRVELLDGWITPKMTRNPPHDYYHDQVADALRQVLPKGWRIHEQKAITTADSQPEPAIAVVLGPNSRYQTRHPAPSDVGLVVEVSDSSLDYDREVKGPLYARAAIPVYWIVNLVEGIFEVYTNPEGDSYLQRQDFTKPNTVPVVLSGQSIGQISTAGLLP